MYIGGTDKESLHQLFWEIIANSIDEVIMNHCEIIKINFFGKLVLVNLLSYIDTGQWSRDSMRL